MTCWMDVGVLTFCHFKNFCNIISLSTWKNLHAADPDSCKMGIFSKRKTINYLLFAMAGQLLVHLVATPRFFSVLPLFFVGFFFFFVFLSLETESSGSTTRFLSLKVVLQHWLRRNIKIRI